MIARAWCDECLMDCFFAYDEATGANEHLGASSSDLANKAADLQSRGYVASHRNRVYTYTLYKAASLAQPLPLEWEMLQEAKEPEYIQDW